jgi:hypothetical protein
LVFPIHGERGPEFDMRGLVFALALILGGCAGIESMSDQRRVEGEINVAPVNYRADILAAMRTYLNDPRNVRDAYVSEPALKGIEGGTRYISCLRYNARKSGGQYAGSKDSIITFRAGRLDRIIDNPIVRELCKDATYVRFPELEQLSR